MQKANLILALIVTGILVSLASHLLSNFVIVLPSASADVTDRSFAATCNASPVAAYAADLTINLVALAPTSSGSQTFATATLTLANGINGDTDPNLNGQTFFSSGTDAGSVLITYQGPKVKISGLGCQPLLNSSLLFKAKTNDNSNKLKVAVQAPSESNSVWNDAKRLDNNTTGFTTHGTSGTIHTSPINDTTDAEGLTNGEVVFGTTDPSKGGHEMQVLIKVANSVVTNQSEEFTLVFTAS